ARAAYPLAAGAAEGEGRIDLRFDPDQRVEDHRAAIVAVDEIDVDMRIGVVVRVPAIDAEFGQPRGVGRLRPGLARLDARILGQSQLDHRGSSIPGTSSNARISVASINPRLRLDVADVVAHRIGMD